MEITGQTVIFCSSRSDTLNKKLHTIKKNELLTFHAILWDELQITLLCDRKKYFESVIINIFMNIQISEIESLSP